MNSFAASLRRSRSLNPIRAGALILGVLVALPASGLNPARSLPQYSCRTWVRQNGLPANGVSALCQTQDGYLWLGTSRGLVRFDGQEFKLMEMGDVSGVRSAIITTIARAEQGGFWFGMERGGFGSYDGKELSILARDEWGGKNLYVQALLEARNGDLWIGSERLGARLTRGREFNPVLTTATGTMRYDVSAMCEDSQGRIWLGTVQQGLFCWSNGVLTRLEDPALDELMIRCLAEDREGKIWVGTQHGLICYDSSFKRQPLPWPWYETRALLVDRAGTVWAGTTGGGLVRYQNGTSSQFRRTDGLADDFVNAIAEDQEGSLWVGTRNGLSQLCDVKIPTLGKSEGLTAEVNVGVYSSRKSGLWVATDTGFAWFDGLGHPYPTNGLRNPYITRIFEARNGDLLLVNASKDIEVFSNGQIVARHTNSAWPTAMVEDGEGMIVAAGGKLYRVSREAMTPYAFRRGAPPLRWAFSMCPGRDGSIWIAGHSDDVGICRVKDGEFTLWGREQGLPETKVLWICEDEEGVVWAGLERGLARLKDGRLRLITRENGLFDNIIHAIVPDDHGLLWVDSSRGFFSVSRRSLNDFADGRTARVECVGYDGLDAIKSSEKNQQQPSGCKTPDGRIWFPTAQGIVMIDPANMPANRVPPQVHVERVRANGKDLDNGRTAVVAPGRGELEIQYAGVSFIAPNKIQYRYRLQGYDSDWVLAGPRRSAFYTNLKPGEYAFQVQACNENGIWSTGSAGFEVTLLPHFYETAWFTILAGWLVIGLLLGIYAWRVRHLRQKQRRLQEAHDMLEHRVQERTSELKNEIEERKRMELEVERIHRQLLDASRQAGQAEVASSVLHNVGNVLNSVNVSTSLIADRLHRSRLPNLAKALALIREHESNLAGFLLEDERGRKLLPYLENLTRHFGDDRDELLSEIKNLAQNIEHIKEIVAMQQSYATVSGVVEEIRLPELVDSALKMQSASYQRHSIQIVREFESVPPIHADRHKVLQIVVNILQNASRACDDSGRPDKIVTVRLRRQAPELVRIEIADNGIGIVPENLTRIFSHGFTTRKNGHGFGLHSASLASKQMGGTLKVYSDGPGQGALFVLELPVQPADGVGAGPTRQSVLGARSADAPGT